MTAPQEFPLTTSRRVATIASVATAIFGLGIVTCFLMACWYHPAPTTLAMNQWIGTAFTLGLGLPATLGLTAATYTSLLPKRANA